MADYRIRWRVRGTTGDASWINTSGATGLLLVDDPQTISGISGAGTTITVTTSSAHNFKVGQGVILSGVSPTAYNGLVTVATVPSTTTFTYTVAANPGSSPSGGTVSPTQGVTKAISQVTGTGTTATATTTTVHGFKVGDEVRVTGVSVTGYNKTVSVESVPTTTTFTFASTTSTTGTGGNAISQAVFEISAGNSSTAISANTTYDVEVAYEPLTGTATFAGAVTATPLSAGATIADMPAGTTETTISSGSNYTASTGTGSNKSTATRVTLSDGGSFSAAGLKVVFTGSLRSWTSCTCTVTYLGKTWALTATKQAATSKDTAYFIVPLTATVTISYVVSGGSSGSFTISPYVA